MKRQQLVEGIDGEMDLAAPLAPVAFAGSP